MREVVLYTRKGCGLCEEAKAEIAAARREVDFTYTEVDIDSDASLYEEHKWDIPVIAVDGHRAFKYRVAKDALVARLRR